MVMLATNDPMTYELYDDRGLPVGRIELPSRELRIGPHAGTVLLRRELPRPVRDDVRPVR
jgi:hypothetical protein